MLTVWALLLNVHKMKEMKVKCIMDTLMTLELIMFLSSLLLVVLSLHVWTFLAIVMTPSCSTYYRNCYRIYWRFFLVCWSRISKKWFFTREVCRSSIRKNQKSISWTYEIKNSRSSPEIYIITSIWWIEYMSIARKFHLPLKSFNFK